MHMSGASSFASRTCCLTSHLMAVNPSKSSCQLSTQSWGRAQCFVFAIALSPSRGSSSDPTSPLGQKCVGQGTAPVRHALPSRTWYSSIYDRVDPSAAGRSLSCGRWTLGCRSCPFSRQRWYTCLRVRRMGFEDVMRIHVGHDDGGE